MLPVCTLLPILRHRPTLAPRCTLSPTTNAPPRLPLHADLPWGPGAGKYPGSNDDWNNRSTRFGGLPDAKDRPWQNSSAAYTGTQYLKVRGRYAALMHAPDPALPVLPSVYCGTLKRAAVGWHCATTGHRRAPTSHSCIPVACTVPAVKHAGQEGRISTWHRATGHLRARISRVTHQSAWDAPLWLYPVQHHPCMCSPAARRGCYLASHFVARAVPLACNQVPVAARSLTTVLCVRCAPIFQPQPAHLSQNPKGPASFAYAHDPAMHFTFYILHFTSDRSLTTLARTPRDRPGASANGLGQVGTVPYDYHRAYNYLFDQKGCNFAHLEGGCAKLQEFHLGGCAVLSQLSRGAMPGLVPPLGLGCLVPSLGLGLMCFQL